MSINQSTNPVDVIATTQQLRLKMVEKLTEGDRIPTEAKEVGVLSMILRDLDAAALTTRKLDVEEKGVDVASKASANVANILKELGGQNPFRIGTVENGRQLPTTDVSQIPVIDLVPGVMRIGADVLEYGEFVTDENANK